MLNFESCIPVGSALLSIGINGRGFCHVLKHSRLKELWEGLLRILFKSYISYFVMYDER